MSDKTVYLVTGTNRGIGYGLVATLAERPNAIVFAGARDPTAKSLTELAAKFSNVHPVKLVVSDKASNDAAIAEIAETAGQLDVVIANAGICKQFGPIATSNPDDFLEHYQINSLGLIILWQATHKLLLASSKPQLVYISSFGGSLGAYKNLQAPAYMGSKAAANFIVKTLDAENPTVTVYALHPGWVQTDLGNAGAVANGMPQAPNTVERCITGILNRVDNATKEKTSGKFLNFETMAGPPQTDEIAW
ncbi:aflatoxin biosynthesis ketoreductase-like protein nor-1 [Roridomyces roridus]|uniref:Aflatoxin biosynthesis ketoreductase-like protein nor-1 n=1 Tax=Roridomyces roridus TaxID=1738132 RepID=A0AAD7CAC9_9AGAR|nr:aflatoxin biosynthesis ketoreductase-like protein nor-1 [Roridomyces roridus]